MSAMSTASEVDIKRTIQAVVDGRELTTDEATAAMDAIMSGTVTGKEGGVVEVAVKGSNSLGDHVKGTVRLALPGPAQAAP